VKHISTPVRTNIMNERRYIMGHDGSNAESCRSLLHKATQGDILLGWEQSALNERQ